MTEPLMGGGEAPTPPPNPYGEANAGGRAFRAGTFGEAWEVFSDHDDNIRGLGAQAGQEISDYMVKNQDTTFEELKSELKKVLPHKMKPYVDLADETGRAFYDEYRTATLGGSTIPSKKAPSTMNIIDQEGNIISAKVPVGQASASDVFGHKPDVGKSVVPARSWKSAVGGAFKNAEDIAVREGKWEALNRISSKLIGYSDRRIQNVYRDVTEQAAIGDPYSVGWQRIAYAGSCAFCRMLAGRGAVYKTNASASFVVGRGVVRKVRGRPHKRGRKARAWERPEHRQIREMNSAFHDNCQCKVIPRFTFNGAEMPLPPLLQFMQDKYNAEYYAARETLTMPKPKRQRIKIPGQKVPRNWNDVKGNLKGLAKYTNKRADQYVWGTGRKPHVYDLLGITKWDPKRKGIPKVGKAVETPTGRDILRVMRKNNMTPRQRRFMPTKPHDYMVDQIASAWPGSPYMRPAPMRVEDFAKDYVGQAFRGLKQEGGILARRKGNQYVGRWVNKHATRTQRRVNRGIDQAEWIPTWGKGFSKAVVAEGRRKTTRTVRYNTKQGLKYATGQQPQWNVEGLFRRELDETVRFHTGQARRSLNRQVDSASDWVFQSIKSPINQVSAPVYDALDKGSKTFGGWGSLFTDPIKTGLKGRERRVIRRLNRPFKRRATRLKRAYAKDGEFTRYVKARTGDPS